MLTTAFILITPLGASLISEKPCLADSFYGSFNGQSIFNLSPTCFASMPKLDSGVIIPTYHPIQQLVWIQKQSVDEALWMHQNTTSLSALDQLFNRLSTTLEPSSTDSRAYGDQQVFITSESDAHYEILYHTSSAALLSLNPAAARIVDTILPPFYKSSLLFTSRASYVPVPEEKVEAVKRFLSSLKFNPVVASIVNSISIPQMKRDIRYLTGEDDDSPILSRHSFAAGSRIAAAWLKEHFEATGATCELKDFLVGFAPNVICRYPSTVETSATVILSAHYDSRGSLGSTKAPGGDDDGSGVVALMGIARTILHKGLTFRSNVELVAFAGEEQGLLGSKAYSRELREAGANITVMMQADMLAYRAPGEPPQLGLPDVIGTLEVAQLVSNVSAIYSPELKVGFTPACCSDHQSFHEQGFPATHIFERAGPIIDPMYHNSGDISDRENYDFDQVKSIAKVEFATLLHVAGFDLPE
ncbi:hypothetical protein PILCRDRAFT_825388 [Piloderma croceum F 1598]|uniref:Peptide hydrolase n=1 Tax=Piloderma croceum (strain F 1598) TaxID=765440 RepID=A0A0C3EY30_PILCF|nr:hypothetical protein PILCRDRAFT_825388 [Piloderma croceum F 1598]